MPQTPLLFAQFGLQSVGVLFADQSVQMQFDRVFPLGIDRAECFAKGAEIDLFDLVCVVFLLFGFDFAFLDGFDQFGFGHGTDFFGTWHHQKEHCRFE